MEKKLRVLFAAAECSPYIKVGGLGDVAGELPVKLSRLGADVRVVIPGNTDIAAPSVYIGDYPVRMGGRTETCIVREILDAPVRTYITDNYQYFGRQGVYGYSDDAERFAFFCLSVYEMIRRLDFKPDILHLNDWHTAPLAMIIRENEREYPELADISIVYTIHNLEYQGVCDRGIFRLYGIRDSVFMVDKVEYYGCFNPMKAGINYSDIINAVSKTSANEMLTPRFGFGLDGVLINRKQAVRGIINGIDQDRWDPGTDGSIYVNYNKEDLDLKRQNKKMLQKESGLDDSDAPLFAVISRLVPNKGLDLMEPAFRYILKNNCQLILLGNGEKYYENIFMDLAKEYPGLISVNLEFNPGKARKIYAGSDILLMPSRYEPCGISQLIAMRYGTVPLVHRTGGLADTVIDEDKRPGAGNGFAFGSYSIEAFIRTIKRAVNLFRNKEAWTGLVKRTMSSDYSWDRAAAEYLSLYREAEANNNRRKAKEGRH